MDIGFESLQGWQNLARAYARFDSEKTAGDKMIIGMRKREVLNYTLVISLSILLGSLCVHFPFYYILPIAIIPILFLFQINHKYFLLLLLILGFVLFARAFAHLGIAIGGLPLYITEAVLFATLTILFLDKLVGGDKVNYLKNIPLKKEFILFYLIGFVALVRGFIYYTPILTLRHSALFYYSIFYFLMPVLFNNLKRVELLFKLFFIASIVVPVAILLKITPQLNVYGELGGFNYLYLSLAVIVESFYFVSLKKRIYKLLLLLIIALQLLVILTGQVRGAWIALLVSMFFFLYLSSRMGKLKAGMRRVFLLAIIGGIALVILTALIKPILFSRIKTEALSMVFFSQMENVEANNVRWRLFLWRDMLKELSEKPLFGWGFGRPFRSPTLEALGWEHGAKEGWIDPHNSHLNIAYKAGIIGYLVFLLIMVGFFKRAMRFLFHIRGDNKTKLYIGALLTCSVNVLVLSFFEVVLEGPYMGSFLWITMGLIVALENIYKKKKVKF